MELKIYQARNGAIALMKNYDKVTYLEHKQIVQLRINVESLEDFCKKDFINYYGYDVVPG